MEILIVITLALMGMCFLILGLVAAVLAWKYLRALPGQPAERSFPQGESATPEELEERKLAAETQRLYEQGFVNLMRYDGSPGRKEREVR